MKKKLFYNTIASLLFQILTIICGFILPRLFIREYGSDINGLVSSITQFLSIISFLELGVGAVIQSSLYKPLAQQNYDEISAIHVSGSSFFKKIAYIMLVYVIILTIVYPLISNQYFDWIFTATLILAISISFFSQYYFGIIDRVLLVADQRGYVVYNWQIVALLLNTTACVVLIYVGVSIHWVKFVTSMIYLLRPLVIRIYVNSHYKINRKALIKKDPIKQKWHAVTQHVSHIVLNDTDTIVLTLFSTLSNVSIYSIYYMVINGIKTLFTATTNGFQSILGEMFAKGETTRLYNFFSMIEYLLHTVIVLIFTVTGILIIPFVKVYTNNVADINYIYPTFALLLVLAHACHCLSTPYHIMIKAAGHFKQTSKNYIIAALINIVVSVIMVYFLGLIGVAIGTLMAMLYQTIWMAIYNAKYLIKHGIKSFIKQCLVDVVCVISIVFATYWIPLTTISFMGWLLMAVEVFVIAMIVILVINLVVSRKKIKNVISFIKH